MDNIEVNTILGALGALLVGQGILRVLIEWILQRGTRKANELQVIIKNLSDDNANLRSEVTPLRSLNAQLAAEHAQKDVTIATLRATTNGQVQRFTAMQLELDERERDIKHLEQRIKELHDASINS